MTFLDNLFKCQTMNAKFKNLDFGVLYVFMSRSNCHKSHTIILNSGKYVNLIPEFNCIIFY